DLGLAPGFSSICRLHFSSKLSFSSATGDGWRRERPADDRIAETVAVTQGDGRLGRGRQHDCLVADAAAAVSYKQGLILRRGLRAGKETHPVHRGPRSATSSTGSAGRGQGTSRPRNASTVGAPPAMAGRTCRGSATGRSAPAARRGTIDLAEGQARRAPNRRARTLGEGLHLSGRRISHYARTSAGAREQIWY